MTELYISDRMRGKMKGFSSLNTNPLTNDFCMKMNSNEKVICSHCYSITGLQRWCMGADAVWQKNGDILSKELIRRDNRPFIMDKMFRFHSHGELLNDIHFANFCLIAQDNPDTMFALWTKRTNIIHRNAWLKPDNMILIYSDHKIDNMSKYIPKGFDKKFSVFHKEFAEENGMELNCEGKSCIDCLICYKKNGIKYIQEKLK